MKILKNLQSRLKQESLKTELTEHHKNEENHNNGVETN
jgi:hypothetical protein